MRADLLLALPQDFKLVHILDEFYPLFAYYMYTSYTFACHCFSYIPFLLLLFYFIIKVSCKIQQYVVSLSRLSVTRRRYVTRWCQEQLSNYKSSSICVSCKFDQSIVSSRINSNHPVCRVARSLYPRRKQRDVSPVLGNFHAKV